MLAHYLCGIAQAKAMALYIVPVAGWHPEKFLKYFFPVLFGYAGTIILEFEPDTSVSPGQLNFNIHRFIAILQAIVYQVHQYALHMEFVHRDHEIPASGLKGNFGFKLPDAQLHVL